MTPGDRRAHPPLLLGLDPGLASCGVALVELAEPVRPVALAVLRTRPSPKRRSILACEDSMRRAAELALGLAAWLDRLGLVAVCSEAQSWPRSAGSAAKVALAFGVLAAQAQARGLPVLQASPQRVKAAVAGSRTASKGEVAEALAVRFGALPWPAGLPRGQREHAADALAAAVACLDAPAVLMARRMLAVG